MTIRFFLLLATVLFGACKTPPPEPSVAERAARREHWIQSEDLMRHIETLASEEYEGRAADAPGGQAAAEYIADRFADFGMEAFGESYFLPLENEALSPNVAGYVRGAGEGWYLLTAHYDHLGQRGDAPDNVFNGADDNASGTAAVIELARAFSACAAELQASVVFVAFTAEEMGLQGSRHFVANPPMPLAQVRGVINMDMIGRGEPDLIFCEGDADAPELAAALERANLRVGLRMRCGEHPDWIPASDHYPFMQKGVPALYLGVEDHEDYHRASDHADKILPELVESVTRMAFGAIYYLAVAEPPPVED